MHRRKEPAEGYKAKYQHLKWTKSPSEHFFWGKKWWPLNGVHEQSSRLVMKSAEATRALFPENVKVIWEMKICMAHQICFQKSKKRKARSALSLLFKCCMLQSELWKESWGKKLFTFRYCWLYKFKKIFTLLELCTSSKPSAHFIFWSLHISWHYWDLHNSVLFKSLTQKKSLYYSPHSHFPIFQGVVTYPHTEGSTVGWSAVGSKHVAHDGCDSPPQLQHPCCR